MSICGQGVVNILAFLFLGILMACPFSGNLIIADSSTNDGPVDQVTRDQNSLGVVLMGDEDNVLDGFIGSLIFVEDCRFVVEFYPSEDAPTVRAELPFHEVSVCIDLRKCKVLCHPTVHASGLQNDRVRVICGYE